MLNQLNRDRSSPPVPQSGSNEQEITDTVDAVLSISSLVLRCFKDFQTLLSALSTQHELSGPRSKVSEELGRLRVWAGNFGAHRKQTDRLSLDHRLREAPDLHRGVRNHLNDLSETIQEGTIPKISSLETSSQIMFSKCPSFKKPQVDWQSEYDGRGQYGLRELRLGWILGADQDRGLASIAH